jgi:hypothetical protein
VYAWIWRRLPGGPAGKIAGTLLLAAAALALLLFVVFPAVEPLLPWEHVTVGNPTLPTAPSSPATTSQPTSGSGQGP